MATQSSTQEYEPVHYNQIGVHFEDLEKTIVRPPAGWELVLIPPTAEQKMMFPSIREYRMQRINSEGES